MLWKNNEEFARLVRDYGAVLRKRGYQELLSHLRSWTAGGDVTIDGRHGSMGFWVDQPRTDSIRVVVQGELDCRWWRAWKEVQFDGFYMSDSGRISPMPDEEFGDFD